MNRLLTHRYFDHSEKQLLLSDEEYPFPQGHLLISRSNLRGNITHFNQSFVNLSGFSREELLGSPHALIRHPDMPRAVFADLWRQVQQGLKWHGYLKNLRKDGRFYWVYAAVVPNYRGDSLQGYTSVQRQASPRKIAEQAALYAAMLAEEQQAQRAAKAEAAHE